jgi:cytochrome c oxidase accessory protein FixG
MSDAFLEPEEHVLSTLEADGSRRWLKPKLSKHKLLQYRRFLAWFLIAIFTAVPFIKLAGKPLLLLDITARRFTIFGFTFLPTDTVLLAIFVVGLLISIFLFTALFGRVWCGWACPQTVYMEFLFRPVERLFDGTVGRGGHKKNIPAWRTVGKYVVYFLLCFYLANTFLAYFVGVDRLSQWVTRSPFEHPVPFVVMGFVTFAMMVDFCFFREQMCTIACPYGRFQSVLLDENSLVVAYDSKRGEPRGKIQKGNQRATINLPVVGDCISCGNCVTTCPTGIDIREGLQMECINCTQCIDACNLVMEKIGRAPNLIRYSSQAYDSGRRTGWLRARTAVYPFLLLGIATLFVTVLFSSKSFDAVLLREPGNPHMLTDDDRVLNVLKMKLTNRTDAPMTFTTVIQSPERAAIEFRESELALKPGQSRTFHFDVTAPRNEFDRGRSTLRFRLQNDSDTARNLQFTLLGPFD